MTFACPLKKIAAAIAIAASLGAASPAWADISASATTSGSASSYTLVARVTPDAQYLGRGKLYFVMLHGSQIYVLSETRGFLAYTGGEPVEYRTITQATETITVQGWNTVAQAGASIFVGYGSDVMDMLNNGRFKLVATLPSGSTPEPPSIPPVETDPYAVHNGSYLCYSETNATYTVTATITATQIVVDTSTLPTIPDYTMSLPFTRISSNGDRIYASSGLPLRLVTLNTTPGARYPLGVTYTTSIVSSPRVYICSKR
jgi:hypothetical protein